MSQVKFNPMNHGDVENPVSVLKESIDAGNLATPGKKLKQPRKDMKTIIGMTTKKPNLKFKNLKAIKNYNESYVCSLATDCSDLD